MSSEENSNLVPNSGKKRPPAAGKGRPKGAKNKINKTVREAIEASFEIVGGAEYLARMANEQPTAYMTLLGKVLPTQVEANVTTKALPASVDEFV